MRSCSSVRRTRSKRSTRYFTGVLRQSATKQSYIADALGHMSSPGGHLLPHKHCRSLYLAFDAGALQSRHEKRKTRKMRLQH